MSLDRARISATVLLALLLGACAAAVPVGDQSAVPVHELRPGEKLQTTVQARAFWQNSGLMVEEGGAYDIRATGRWTMGPICGWTDPSGSGVAPICAGGSRLIGRIGEHGEDFHIGKKLTLEAEDGGVLFLRAADDDNWVFVNDGSARVTIRRRTSVAAIPQRPVAPPSAPTVTKPDRQSGASLSDRALPLTFTKRKMQPDDIAVIIGNADYQRQGQDIPNVVPAYADAESFKRYALIALGIREGNIIYLRDATGAQLERVFGSERTHKGQLFDWIRPNRSRVWVYYSGHGAPAGSRGAAYLVPVDADGSRIEINGYPLDVLYRNLARLPARSVTVVLEACFSGGSEAGSLMAAASGIYLKPTVPRVPARLTVISAGAADQIASWEKDWSNSLFTKYFLTGMSGEADKDPYGDGDGKVEWKELGAFLKDTLTYYARRYYGRDQEARIIVGKGE